MNTILDAYLDENVEPDETLLKDLAFGKNEEHCDVQQVTFSYLQSYWHYIMARTKIHDDKISKLSKLQYKIYINFLEDHMDDIFKSSQIFSIKEVMEYRCKAKNDASVTCTSDILCDSCQYYTDKLIKYDLIHK